ncbi:hypothetical protein ABBQ38_006086 [Trebouxia sp. C0009 RCD-2024]
MPRFAANKAAMKLAEKAAKHADTARRRGEVQQKFAAMTEEEREAWRLARQAKRQDRRAETEQKRSKLQQAMQDGQGIVIDLDFEEQMTETEIKSLCGQLQYCYSSNTRSAVPCHLYFTSMQGGIAKQAEKQLSGMENWHVTRQQMPYIDFFQERKIDLVYLTADSPNELSELDGSKLYIIGGIVDRNRHKNICFNKAVSQDIQTARLPIEAYIKLASSKVLTVNHVVEILLAWLECQDWKEAFFRVIPTRKRAAEDASAAAQPEELADQPDESPEASVQAEKAMPGASVVIGAACCDQPSCVPLDSPGLSQEVIEPSEKRTKLDPPQSRLSLS